MTPSAPLSKRASSAIDYCTQQPSPTSSMSIHGFPNGAPVPPPQSKPLTLLITGASQGIGFELVKQYTAAHPDNVIFATVRDPAGDSSTALHKFAQSAPHIHIIALDVSDEASIKASLPAVRVHTDKLDLLINNAGISGHPTSIPDSTRAELIDKFITNSVGPFQVVQTYLPLLQASSASPAQVINVSSGLGSNAIAAVFGKGVVFPAYGTSKAALNYLNTVLAECYDNIQFTSISPGFVRTRQDAGQKVSVEECVNGIRHLIATTGLKESGLFIDNITREQIPY